MKPLSKRLFIFIVSIGILIPFISGSQQETVRFSGGPFDGYDSCTSQKNPLSPVENKGTIIILR